MNSKYEVIRQFVAAHGGRAELIEHETAIEDSYHTLAIDPRLVCLLYTSDAADE